MKDSDFLPKIENTHDNLMSFEDYAEKHRDGVYEYSFEGLDVFGALHTHDASDPMFDTIESRLDAANPDIVLIEGMENINQWSDEKRREFIDHCEKDSDWREDLKRKAGESGYTAALAILSGREVFSPEPDFASEIAELEKTHNKEHIFAYYIFRMIAQYQRTEGEDMALEDYLSGTVEKMKNTTQWVDFDYSLDEVKKVLKDLYGVDEIDPSSELYSEAIDPVPWKDRLESQTAINRVSSASSNYRDQNIMKEIQRLKKEGRKIFVVYGASHAQRLEPALKALYT